MDLIKLRKTILEWRENAIAEGQRQNKGTLGGYHWASNCNGRADAYLNVLEYLDLNDGIIDPLADVDWSDIRLRQGVDDIDRKALADWAEDKDMRTV